MKMFFFFKQKTAYEMRISDWSSDVCSSDLEPLDLDARRIEVDQDHGLLPVNLCLRVGFAHQDRELAARIGGPRRPPFASVNDIMLAVAPNGRTNVGSVGRCDVGFRHEESRADLRSEEHTSELQTLMSSAYAV